MKLRSLLAATLVLCLFMGGAVLYTKPAQDRSPKQHVVVPPPNNLSFFDLDKEDRREAQRLTPEEINKIKKKSGQRTVNGMVSIRQDQLPATIMAGLDPDYDPNPQCLFYGVTIPGDWRINKVGDGEVANVDEKNGWDFSVGGTVSIPDGAEPGIYKLIYQSYEECTTEGEPGNLVYYYTFQITGDLTGNVSIAKVEGLEACVDLKADASKDQKVVSAEINWGDGNTTTVSPAPNTQHYFGNECHTYSSAGTYTITATYKDDASPQNSISPSTSATVDCINSASMSIKSAGSSNGKDPIKGLYTYCYTATVSHSTAAGESYSYEWIFPDNTTVNSGGSSSDTTASFCVITNYIGGQSNFGVVSCKITKTTPTPTPSCDVTVSGQIASPGGPPPPPPPGPPPGDPPGAPGNPPC